MLKAKYEWKENFGAYEPKQSKYHPKVEELVVSRNLGTADALASFIDGLEEGHDPFLMKDMEKAVERIHLAVDNQEKVLIYGDYDADGVTSIAILIRCLQELGADVDYYIPNRFFEGYGPNADAFNEAVAQGYQLVITVDNGIAGIEEAKILADHGVDLIITDHHHAKEELPAAFAIIHPELEEHYPWSYLSGSGVALKVAQALLDGEVPEMYYTIAMLGTVGDVVSLQDENRYIVKRGLAELQQTDVPGLIALMENAGTKISAANEVSVGFEICPRLNAPGRMDDARLAAELLITDDLDEAKELADQIEALNDERKEVTKQVEAEALAMAKTKNSDDHVYILYHEDWHEGILGIVAGKISKQLGKAVFMLTEDEFGQAKGSARSVEGFHLFDMLTKAEGLVEKFGGHELAAGLTVDPSNIPALERALNDQMAGASIQPTLDVDLEITLSEAGFELINQFSALSPFGEGNRRPLVKIAGVNVANVKAIGNKLQHLKFTLQDGSQSLDAIAFNIGSLSIYFTADTLFDFVGELNINEFNGKRAVQFMVSDVKCDQFQLIDLRNRQAYEAHKSKFEGAAYFSASKGQEALATANDLIIDELPESVEAIQSCAAKVSAKNIVVVPYAPITFASRDKFVKFFTILKKHPEFALTEQTYSFFQRQELSKNEVNFILRVFFENEIVIINKTAVSLNEGAAKRPLTDSATYRLQEAKSKMYEFFELRTDQDLKEILF